MLTSYLAIEAGGYDFLVRNQLGIIIWWAILLGALAGLLPLVRVTRAGLVGIAILAGLAVWTAVATLTWTESTERSVVELSRVLTLLGILVLFTLTQRRDGLRHAVSGIGAAAAVIAVIALLSRFHPEWFPASEIPSVFPTARLSYPLEYWNGLAALLAMGFAPILWVMVSGRTTVGRSVAAGAVPLLVLALYLTASRGGIAEAVLALITLVVLFPKRVFLALNMLIPAAGAALLLVLISQRPELRDQELGTLASSQGSEMVWFSMGLFLIVASAHAGLCVALSKGLIRVPTASRRAAVGVGVAAASLVVIACAATVVSGALEDRWSEFRQPAGNERTVSRLGSLGSNERYLIWDSAVDASASAEITGIGPGAFEYWWSRQEGNTYFVRDAHSLYLESLAEMGPIGLLMVLGLVALPIGVGVSRAVRRGSDDRRGLLAAATASCIAFAAAAAVDWVWEMTVIPVAFLILVAAILGPGAESRGRSKESRFRRSRISWKGRSVIALGAVVGIGAIAAPTVSTSLVRQSQESFRRGDPAAALDKAETASRVAPYSAVAETQVALVQVVLSRPAQALAAACEATQRDPLDWRTWLVLSNIAREAGSLRLARLADARVAQTNTRYGSTMSGTVPVRPATAFVPEPEECLTTLADEP